MNKLFAIAILFVVIGALGVTAISLGGFGSNSPQPVVEAGFGWDFGPTPSPSPAP